MFSFIKTLLITSPCWICSDLKPTLTMLLTLTTVGLAVNNSWLQVSCDGWCWHRENRMSNMFLTAPAAACGSDSDPFGNLQLKLQTAQRYYIIQSWGWKVSFRCFLCSSCSVVALYTITASSLKPKLLISVHHVSRYNSHLPWTWQICMKNHPLKEFDI